MLSSTVVSGDVSVGAGAGAVPEADVSVVAVSVADVAGREFKVSPVALPQAVNAVAVSDAARTIDTVR